MSGRVLAALVVASLAATTAEAKTLADRVNAVASAPDLKTALRRTLAIRELHGKNLLYSYARWRARWHPQGTPVPDVLVKSHTLSIRDWGRGAPAFRLRINDQLRGGGKVKSVRTVDVRRWKLKTWEPPVADVADVTEAFPELAGENGPRVLAETLRAALRLK